MTYWKHISLHKYDTSERGFTQAAYDELVAKGYSKVIEEDELEEILATDIDHPETRPIFGQSPYIINSMINYTNDSIGLSINASFNVSGEKLVLITPGGTPDVYDQPRPSLDLSINYKLSEKVNLNMKAVSYTHLTLPTILLV